MQGVRLGIHVGGASLSSSLHSSLPTMRHCMATAITPDVVERAELAPVAPATPVAVERVKRADLAPVTPDVVEQVV